MSRSGKTWGQGMSEAQVAHRACEICGGRDWYASVDPLPGISVTTPGTLVRRPLGKAECRGCGVVQKVVGGYLGLSDFYEKDYSTYFDGHYRITHDPYGVRNGSVVRAFASREEVSEGLGVHFGDLALGLCENDFYGIYEKMWIGTGLKKAP